MEFGDFEEIRGDELKDVHFKKCKLKDAIFNNVICINVDFEEAEFNNTVFRGGNLENVDFSNVNLQGVAYDQFTKWPKKFNPKQAGAQSFF